MTSESDVEGAISLAIKQFGSLNIAVSCAGVASAKVTYNPNTDKCLALSEFQRVINVSGLVLL